LPRRSHEIICVMVTWLAFAVLAVSTISGCASPSVALAQSASQIACELPQPEVLLEDGGAVLQKWELLEQPLWFSETMPRDAGYAAYRTAVRDAGGDQPRPAVFVPDVQGDAERELWRRETANVALMYGGGGDVRAVTCLEVALFVLQDARNSQLTRPSEFIAHILRKDGRLKIYFGAGDGPFPPKSVYGIDQVAADVAAGWMYSVALHNHPLQRRGSTLALGVPVPSTSDVSLLSGLVARLGLREVWVTNGVYTGVVSAASLVKFSGR
jgi:hypothetical protein